MTTVNPTMLRHLGFIRSSSSLLILPTTSTGHYFKQAVLKWTLFLHKVLVFMSRIAIGVQKKQIWKTSPLLSLTV
jgi:hypothetical protein